MWIVDSDIMFGRGARRGETVTLLHIAALSALLSLHSHYYYCYYYYYYYYHHHYYYYYYYLVPAKLQGASWAA